MGAQNKMESPLAITVGSREREGEARLAASTVQYHGDSGFTFYFLFY